MTTINFRTYILLLGAINFIDASNIQPIFQNISRNRTQTANGSCQIPNNPLNGKYSIGGDDANTYKEGDHVRELVGLYLKCDGTYRPSPPEVLGSLCINGVWEPPPTVCSHTCKSIRNTETTEVQCSFNGLDLKSCEKPVEGTVAKFTCEAFHEEPSLENNPYRFCEDGDWKGIPYCTPICGQKHPAGRPNVINGTNAKLGDYPWHVGVYNAQKDYRCGGSIITQRIILSAAHCFTNLATGEVYPNENYLIAAGKYHREYSDPRDEHYQYSTIDSIHIPSRYKGSRLQYQADIAVVVLAKQLILTEAVQPVCVDWGNRFENHQLTPKSNGTVIGWGYTVEGLHLSDELKELIIPFIPFEQCYDSVPRAFQTFLRQDKICGGYLNSGTSVCEGDSGGGLVFPQRFTGRYFIRGVVSTSPATIEKQCDSNQYGIYTLVSLYLDFINSARNKRRPIPNTPTLISSSINSKFPSASSIMKNESTLSPIITSTPVTAPSTTASNLRCLVPNSTDYRINPAQTFRNPGNSYQAGYVLTTRCDDEQNLNRFHSTCVDGSWKPELPNCAALNLLPTKEVCGIFQDSGLDAIETGTETALYEFPWLVMFHNEDIEDNSNICEGVLINNRYVLTSGHCLYSYPRLNRARLGEHNVDTNPDCGSTNICAPSPIIVPIAEKIIHEKYQGGEISRWQPINDIGLVRLELVVTFTDYIKPICLPTLDNIKHKKLENHDMIVAGWTSRLLNPIKSKFKVPVKPTIQCRTDINGTSDEMFICIGQIRNDDFCVGVGGSALMKYEDDWDRSNWYAIGILSTSSRCRMLQSRVTTYIPWILSKIKP